MNGLINIADENSPLVVQVVQKRIFPFETLRSPPEGKVRGFIVFIVLGPIEGAIESELCSRMDVAETPVLLR